MPSAAEEWRAKRRRRQLEREEEETSGIGGEEINNDVSSSLEIRQTAAKRLRQEREEALRLMNVDNYNAEGKDGSGSKNDHNSVANARMRAAMSRRALASVGSGAAVSGNNDVNNTEADDLHDNNNNGKNDTNEQKNPNNHQEVESPKDKESNNENRQEKDEGKNEDTAAAATSLLQQAALLKKQHQNLSSLEQAALQRREDEERILKEASHVQTNALQAASELAEGVKYESSLPTGWRCPNKILKQGEDEWEKIRKKWHILVDGEECPPPIRSFRDMGFPKPCLDMLTAKNVRRPTPIQMQGLTVALSGRDMVGIAFTGSGKTLSFSLPLVMAAMEEEARMPLVAGEGPVGIVLAPSRELARQTYDIVCEFCTSIRNANNNPEGGKTYPVIRSQLLIGGESARDQLQPFRDEGVHCVVATPGRLRDFLKKRSINLDICRYICLDEADRMLDLGFDEEVGEIMNHFHHQRQTILYSATFPKKFQDFAQKTLVKPIVVNVGRAGAANLDVIQEVEYVKQEAKIVYLLECLQKTAPPVVIFCEKKGDVDDIHEYLLLKGVEAVSIHGGKDQEERNEAISLYKEGKKDVLVATDVAAKGLDFADIQHVINFDMPSEIENYVHRIGRTGRCGKTGVATTFINKSCEETTLLDLKHLLKEAHQRIPPVLMIMDDPLDNVGADGGTKGCSFCGGLGHTIVDCPKIDKDARRVAGGRRDALATGDGYGGEI